jgi:hypothetical protein
MRSSTGCSVHLHQYFGFYFQDNGIRASPISGTSSSFDSILEILKQNDFQIEAGVDSMEVPAFVTWGESAKHPDKSTK